MESDSDCITQRYSTLLCHASLLQILRILFCFLLIAVFLYVSSSVMLYLMYHFILYNFPLCSLRLVSSGIVNTLQGAA